MKSICNNYSEWQSMLMTPERSSYGQQQDAVVKQWEGEEVESEGAETRERPELEKKLLSTWPKRNSYKNAMRHVSNLVSLQEEAEEGATKRHAAERWRVHGV